MNVPQKKVFFLLETAFHLTSITIGEIRVTHRFSIFHSSPPFRWYFYRHFDPNSIFKMHDTPLLSTTYFSEIKHFETNGRILTGLEFYFEVFMFFLKTNVIFFHFKTKMKY